MADSPKEQPRDYVVGFAVGGADDSGVSKPFEVLRVGEYRRGDRSIPVSGEDLDRAVANFERWKAMGQEIPVDYDHAFNEGREAPAAGWYESLKRQGDALWATVRWTQKAREEIKSQLYRFFSVEFQSDFRSESGEDEGFTVLAGALTNRPFLRGMTPVALSQEIEREIVAWAVDRLELPSRADNSDVSKESDNKPETFKVEVDGKEQEFSAEEIVALHAKAAKADEAEEAAKEKAAEAAASKGQVETLSARVETLESDAKSRDFAELFHQAQREGRLDAKEETEKTWRETFDALGAEKTKALIEQVPAETIPLSAQGRAGSAEQSSAPRGVHVENFKLNEKVEAFLAEHPDKSFEEALGHVQAEMSKAAA